MVDVAAVAVHIIEAIVEHPVATPRNVARRLIPPIHRRDESRARFDERMNPLSPPGHLQTTSHAAAEDQGSSVMHNRLQFLLLSAGLGLAAVPAAAVTPNPTPNLKSGDYQAKWGIMTVGDPSAYGRNNVSANIYPMTVHYDAASGTYTVNDGQQNIRFS